jgi:hypothetical protein
MGGRGLSVDAVWLDEVLRAGTSPPGRRSHRPGSRVRARRRCTRAARYAGRIAGLGNVKTPPSLQARIAVLLLRDPRPWPWIPGE